MAMFQGLPCDCVHDRHGPVVDERSGELSMGCLLGAYVNLLSETLGVNLRMCSSSDWFMGLLDGCSWRGPTCLRAVGDGFVCVGLCVIHGVWRRYDVHPWSLLRGIFNDFHPCSLCGGRWQMICGSTSYFYFCFCFFCSRWLIRNYPGRFFLSGVCGYIFSPFSKQLMEGTDCAKLFITHLNWCIL